MCCGRPLRRSWPRRWSGSRSSSATRSGRGGFPDGADGKEYPRSSAMGEGACFVAERDDGSWGSWRSPSAPRTARGRGTPGALSRRRENRPGGGRGGRTLPRLAEAVRQSVGARAGSGLCRRDGWHSCASRPATPDAWAFRHLPNWERSWSCACLLRESRLSPLTAGRRPQSGAVPVTCT